MAAMPVAPAPALPALDGPPDATLDPNQFEALRFIAGIPCAVRVHAADARLARTGSAAALGEITRVLAKFDGGSRQSEVAAVNASAAIEEVFVSEETHSLLQRCLELCRRTTGAFDLTVASFDYLWNFAARPFVRPLPEEVSARRALSGCQHLAIKPTRAVRLMQPGVRVTLQDMVHGHALERAAATLRKAGIEHFRLRVGHDVYVQGRAGTRHWYVAVPHPRNPEASLVQLYLGSQCAATRSDSDRFVLKNGRRYHDVLDPRTGQPADSVVQVTVISPDAPLADALSAAVFVLGPKAGLALLATEKNAQGFVIDRTGKVHASKGMADLARLPARVEL